jgi:hypothetical protein
VYDLRYRGIQGYIGVYRGIQRYIGVYRGIGVEGSRVHEGLGFEET